DRNKRQNVCSTKPRVFATMSSHVDQLRCSLNCFYRSFNDGLRRGDESYHRTVVIRIDMGVEYAGGVNSGDRFRNERNHFRPTTFTKVWNAFDETGHGTWVSGFGFQVSGSRKVSKSIRLIAT